MAERRSASKFREYLSAFMVGIAALGAGYILLDPQFSFMFEGGTTLKLGGEGFSADLKGATITMVVIGGFVAVKEFWLGASASGQTQSEAMSRIAEAASPAIAQTPKEEVK